MSYLLYSFPVDSVKAGKCEEVGYAYYRNTLPNGRSYQPSKSACQQACAEHVGCSYWSWSKGSTMCYLKTSKAGKGPAENYISGSKDCNMSEEKG